MSDAIEVTEAASIPQACRADHLGADLIHVHGKDTGARPDMRRLTCGRCNAELGTVHYWTVDRWIECRLSPADSVAYLAEHPNFRESENFVRIEGNGSLISRFHVGDLEAVHD